jgi:hypothetical protein
MDAPLQYCTIEEQRGVARFLWAEGVKPVEIHRHTITDSLRHNIRIVLQGDYVEKWYVKLLTVTFIKAVKCFLSILRNAPAPLCPSYRVI